jgi:hypothetical protein
MKTIILVLALSLALTVGAYAASTSGFGSFTSTDNGSMTPTTITTGYYNSGAYFYANASAGAFTSTFTITPMNINGGFSWVVGWDVDPANIMDGNNYDVNGYSDLSAYGASPSSPSGNYMPYQGYSALLGGTSGAGPAMWQTGGVPGTPATYTLSSNGATTTLVNGSTVLFSSATPATGFHGFAFGGDGTYEVSNFTYTDLSTPEPGSIVTLLTGFAGFGMMIIRRKRA